MSKEQIPRKLPDPKQTVLVIDKTDSELAIITEVLAQWAIKVEHSNSLKEARSKFRFKPPQVLILNGNRDFEQQIKEISTFKKRRPNLPILIHSNLLDQFKNQRVNDAGVLSIKQEIPPKLLELVDGYILDSNPDILAAFIRSIIRSFKNNERSFSNDIKYDDLEIELPNLVVKRDGRKVSFGKSEKEVLRVLVSRPGIILREEIGIRVWGDDYKEGASKKKIHSLRRKLGKNAIITFPEMGYMLADKPYKVHW